ncbi:hypothetical protein ES332_A03G204700v1 [Gossypium tomentosum]|uniref:C3H1-type domain-containing protein n=1 Tax=Gossypium tomentosum TaxID=34277 RepID=A0A5D2RAD6_GOSTO|nr:hypothetical protein ES332_A03G204700v1 [Gossypium tomentosum]
MDSFYNENNKLNVLKNSNIPKLMTPARSRGSYYSSPENLIKYLRSNSLSSCGNGSSSGKSSFRSSVSPQSEKTPLKVVEKDVLVMDEVLVASDSNTVGSGSSSSSGSVGYYKSEICRDWEEFGHCRYGSKCQFAHGKEEVRPACLPFRTKSEAQIYKSYASTVSNSYSSKPRLLHPVTETAAFITQKDSFANPGYTGPSFSTPIKPEETIINSLSTVQPDITRLNTNFTMKRNTKTSKINPTSTSTIRHDTSATTFTNGSNWSPQDDRIDVTLPSFPGQTPSKGDIDAYIDNVLHAPATKKRLPVFSAICPE